MPAQNGVAQQQDAYAFPNINLFGGPQAIGPRLTTRNEGTEFVAQGGGQGIMALVSRIIEVPQEQFNQYVQDSIQMEMRKEIEQSTYGGQEGQRSSPVSIFGLPIIDPNSKLAMAWMSLILLMDLFYTGFWVPLNVAFCSVTYGDITSPCTKADFVGGVVYLVHVFVSFQIGTSVVSGYKKRLFMDGAVVASAYIKYGRFWLDLVAALPFLYLVVIVVGNIAATRWIAIVSIARMIRMARLFSLGTSLWTEVADRSSKRGKAAPEKKEGAIIPPGVGYFFIIIYGTVVVMNVEACLLILVAEFEGPEDSWMAALDWVDVVNSSRPYQWYVAFYSAIASNTGTGLMGIGFRNKGEFIVCCGMQLLGMIMFTVLVTVGLTQLTQVSDDAMEMHQLQLKMRRVRNWLATQPLPKTVCKQILAFYSSKWTRRHERLVEDEIVRDMPAFLRGGLLLPSTRNLVNTVDFLKDLQPSLRMMIAQSLVPLEVAEGCDLCHQGDEPDCLWILEQGIATAVSFQKCVHSLQAPSLLGDAVLLVNDVAACRQRFWTLRTLTPCKLWRLSMRDLAPIMRCFPELRTEALTYVQNKLLVRLGVGGGLEDDNHWCELAERVLDTLEAQRMHVQSDIRMQLLKAHYEDTSLQVLLDALLEVSELNKGDARVMSEALNEPTQVLRTNSIASFRVLERAVSMSGMSAMDAPSSHQPHSSSLHQMPQPGGVAHLHLHHHTHHHHHHHHHQHHQQQHHQPHHHISVSASGAQPGASGVHPEAPGSAAIAPGFGPGVPGAASGLSGGGLHRVRSLPNFESAHGHKPSRLSAVSSGIGLGTGFGIQEEDEESESGSSSTSSSDTGEGSECAGSSESGKSSVSGPSSESLHTGSLHTGSLLAAGDSPLGHPSARLRQRSSSRSHSHSASMVSNHRLHQSMDSGDMLAYADIAFGRTSAATTDEAGGVGTPSFRTGSLGAVAPVPAGGGAGAAAVQPRGKEWNGDDDGDQEERASRLTFATALAHVADVLQSTRDGDEFDDPGADAAAATAGRGAGAVGNGGNADGQPGDTGVSAGETPGGNGDAHGQSDKGGSGGSGAGHGLQVSTDDVATHSGDDGRDGEDSEREMPHSPDAMLQPPKSWLHAGLTPPAAAGSGGGSSNGRVKPAGAVAEGTERPDDAAAVSQAELQPDSRQNSARLQRPVQRSVTWAEAPAPAAVGGPAAAAHGAAAAAKCPTCSHPICVECGQVCIGGH